MTTSLVMLTQPEVKWTTPQEPAFIGKDILELLTSSMYVDPMSLFREYIQNAVDAVDLARETGVLHAKGQIEIRIDRTGRNVRICDNGTGLSGEEFVFRLMALGGSKKRGTRFRGFRGVGRLAGLGYCQELIFRSRQDSKSSVHEIRWDSREVRSLIRSADSSQDLRDIIGKAVQTRVLRGGDWPKRFFEVELKGVVRHRDDRLLNEGSIAGYLAQVAPVSFHPQFEFGSEISSFLEGNGVRPGAVNIEVTGYGPVYRPHANAIAMGKSGETRFRELKTTIIPGRDGGVAAASWVLHHDYRGALPGACFMEGWRLRSGDIQVGDNSLLQSLFPESRFNAWCVAETHILDPRILPNGRRDHFEQNAYYFDLLNHLAPQAREIAQRCRASSIARNTLRTIDTQLAECDQRLRALEKGAMTKGSSAKVIMQLAKVLDQLDRLAARSSVPINHQTQYAVRIVRLRKRMAKVAAGKQKTSMFQGFTPTQRSILREICNTIYQRNSNLYQAQNLIDAIVSRLSRARRKSRKVRKKRSR